MAAKKDPKVPNGTDPVDETEQTEVEAPPTDDHVEMHKDGESILVHPAGVEEHEKLGWKQA